MPLDAPQPAPRGFTPLRIAECRQETADAISLTFAIPPEDTDRFRFTPGQYLTLRTRLDGEELRRAYSICAGPADPLRIAIKRVDEGRFSTWAHHALKPGHLLDVMPPRGRFTLPPTSGTPRHVLAVAAGSGITPLLAILKATLAHEPETRVTLLYGSRSTAQILFREELEALKDRFMARLAILHVLSREQQDIPILNGRLDGAKVATLLAGRPIDTALICGPPDLIDDVTARLEADGLPPTRIHAERFTPAPHTGPAPPRPARPPGTSSFATATIIADGIATPIPMREGEMVLDAALRAGLDLPYSCRGGMCSTCRARVTEGTADMAINYGLEPWETAAGFILTCQARPTTRQVTIDYDQV